MRLALAQALFLFQVPRGVSARGHYFGNAPRMIVTRSGTTPLQDKIALIAARAKVGCEFRGAGLGRISKRAQEGAKVVFTREPDRVAGTARHSKHHLVAEGKNLEKAAAEGDAIMVIRARAESGAQGARVAALGVDPMA